MTGPSGFTTISNDGPELAYSKYRDIHCNVGKQSKWDQQIERVMTSLSRPETIR